MGLLPEPINTILARILLVVLIVLLIRLLTSLVVWLLARPLNSLLRRLNRESYGETIRALLVTPINLVLAAAGLSIAIRILEAGPVLVDLFDNAGRTLVIIAVGLVVWRFFSLVLFARETVTLGGIRITSSLKPLLSTALQVILWLLVGVIIIEEWGYNVSGLIAGLGIGGLAISLAAQDTLSNLFAFTAIVGDRPFMVGEYIKTPDVEGTVEKVGLRSTRVRKLDQSVVTVPNNKVANAAVLNWSRLQKRMIDQVIGVSYTTSAAQMRQLLVRIREMLAQQPTVDTDSIVVNLVNIGQQSYEILVRCYLPIADWKAFTEEKERIFLEVMQVIDDLNLRVVSSNASTVFVAGLEQVIGQAGPNGQSSTDSAQA
jgi:MscS family membrane protein